MARQATKLEEWQIEACRLMAAHDLSLREAAAELGIELSIAEADAIQKRVLFKEALEKAKQDYYAEIGASPALSKDLIVGMALKLAERLAADREDYKASDALLKLAKIKGWVGSEPDTLWQTISQLSHNEIQEVRRNLQEKIEEQQREQSQPASSDKPQQPTKPQQVN